MFHQLNIMKIIKKDFQRSLINYLINKSLSKEEKEKKRQCGCNQYKNLPENEK